MNELASRIAATAVDWARIDEWTASIVDGDLAPINAVFATHGTDRTEAVWTPSLDTLTALPLRFLAEHWSRLAGGAVPDIRQIDPLELRPALGYIMLLDPVEGGRDFRYRLYGSTVARISNVDMTGRLISEHSASTYVSEFGIASNRAVLRQRQPLYTTRKPAAAKFTARWQRLALPLADDSGDVVRILAGTVAIDRDGQMIKT